jgi:hypothetical protein
MLPAATMPIKQAVNIFGSKWIIYRRQMSAATAEIAINTAAIR